MMATQLLWYDPKRKRPRLRLKILKLIAANGRLSVHAADVILKQKHHHREIWESFHALHDKELIFKMSDKSFGREGRQIYYRLTQKGFLALISEDMTPKDFWRTLINSSRYMKHIEKNTVNFYFREFLLRYLKYPSVVDNNYFISQLHVFDRLCERWIEETINKDEISLWQKILETLAIYPHLVPGQIAAKLNESTENISLELDRITRGITFDQGGFLIGDDTYYDKSTLLEIMTNFMATNTITKSTELTGCCTYSLSLYGIMLVIFLIRSHERKKLGVRLYLLAKFHIQQSLDIIANNYKILLPLIFGEWDLLKSILKVLSIYNFDVVIDKSARVNMLEVPVLLSGMKEFYDAIKNIAIYSRGELINFFNSGLSVLGEYENELEKDLNAASIVKSKLYEISTLLAYSKGNNPNNNIDVQVGSVQQSSNPSPVLLLQRAFAYEITFIYYINQNRSIYFPDLYPANHYFEQIHIPTTKQRAKLFWSREYDEYSLGSQMNKLFPMSPKQRLLAIMRQSQTIKESFTNCMSDCIRYYYEAGDTMHNISNQLSYGSQDFDSNLSKQSIG